MKFIFIFLFFISLSYASEKLNFDKVSELYLQGSYAEAEQELQKLKELDQLSPILDYWSGLLQNKRQEFKLACESFELALKKGATFRDLHYEYGQALYALDKLKDAREQFKLSVKKGFKKSVSLYYIGFISKELGERQTAYKIFKSIRKIEDEDKPSVIQPVELMIGDLLLEEIKQKHQEGYQSGEIVVSQYRRALDLDPRSKLAPVIREKINENLTLFDIALLRLSNGRPAIYPPYLLKALNEVGLDSNVTFNPTETTISRSKQKSTFNRFDVFGRYTFYHHDYLSITPEIRLNKTYYFNRVPEIYRNDNESLTASLRNGFEHTLFKKPSTLLFDYEFNHSKRDVNSEEKLKFSSRSHTLMLGERFNLLSIGETILRLRYRMFESYLSTRDARSKSLSLEQLHLQNENIFLYSASYEESKVTDSIYNTKSLNLRADYIWTRWRDYVTPTLSLGLSRINPINNQGQRGHELLINPSFRLTKSFRENFRASFKYDYQNYKSKDRENFAYKKDITSVELEYLF